MNSLNTGSATGNPRNKVALAPGRSLMDWVRLCGSGKDMTGTNGALLNVTLEQLAQHNKESDAWMAIRGIVYNVTEYMTFHPGGEEQLMRGVGTDATKLFNEVHPWVNYESLLKACIVGRLRNTGSATTSEWTENIERPINDRVSSLNLTLPTNKNTNVSIIGILIGEVWLTEYPLSAGPVKETLPQDALFIDFLTFVGDETTNTKRVFKMDWFQQANTLTLILYLKPSNTILAPPPQVCVVMASDKQLVVFVENELSVYEFAEDVRWPCQVKVLQTVVELKFIKRESKLWITYGRKINETDKFRNYNTEYHKMKVVRVCPVAHDTKLVAVQYTEKILHFVHVGHHVQFKENINGEDVVRSYTPVVNFYKTSELSFEEPTLYFLIKEYKDGKLSRKLYSVAVGDTLSMSTPRGTFNNVVLKKWSKVYLFAAGTGFTPMTSVIMWTLNATRINVHLIFFNKTENDILWKENIDKLSSENTRFTATYVLSQPSATWSGKTGLISEAIVEEFLSDASKELYVCICGPKEFTNSCKKYVLQRHLPADCVHCFEG